MAEHTDYYALLRVPRQASHREIRQSYRRLVLQLHPDRNPHPDAAEGFRMVQEAWETLGDPVSRALYDQFLDHPVTEPVRRHRDPAYRSNAPRRPREPSPGTLLMYSLVPYAVMVQRIGLAISLLIAVDFFLPAQASEETIIKGYRTRFYHEMTTDKGNTFTVPYPEDRPFTAEPQITAYHSPLLQIIKHIDTRSGRFSLSNLPSVYANLLFMPGVLLLVAAGGLAIRSSAEVTFNFGVVTVLVMLLNIIFFAWSVW